MKIDLSIMVVIVSTALSINLSHAAPAIDNIAKLTKASANVTDTCFNAIAIKKIINARNEDIDASNKIIKKILPEISELEAQFTDVLKNYKGQLDHATKEQLEKLEKCSANSSITN